MTYAPAAEPERIPVGVGAHEGRAEPEQTARQTAPAQPPRKNSDWAYAWVPVLGPLAGGALAGMIAHLVL